MAVGTSISPTLSRPICNPSVDGSISIRAFTYLPNGLLGIGGAAVTAPSNPNRLGTIRALRNGAAASAAASAVFIWRWFAVMTVSLPSGRFRGSYCSRNALAELKSLTPTLGPFVTNGVSSSPYQATTGDAKIPMMINQKKRRITITTSASYQWFRTPAR